MLTRSVCFQFDLKSILHMLNVDIFIHSLGGTSTRQYETGDSNSA